MDKKQLTKAEIQKQNEAWKTLNSVLVRSNAEFMNILRNKLAEKTAYHEQLKKTLESPDADEKSGAEYLFIGGYIQCLEDILHAKRKEEV